MTLASTRELLTIIGWTGDIVRSSAFAVRTERSARLADLTRAVGATHYLCGTSGSRYLDSAPFDELGLRISHAISPDRQTGIWRYARELSALAAMAYTGPTTVQDQLRSGTRTDLATRCLGLKLSSGLGSAAYGG